METTNLSKLKILHIGADPEFTSLISFENYWVEISTADNPFTASQWIFVNGLPDAIICERKLPESDGFGFYDFWVEQFDFEKRIPFILLDEETNSETASKAIQKSIDDVYVKPVKAETLISRILILRKIKPLTITNETSKAIVFVAYKTPFFKRTFDIVFASLGLVIVSPLLLLFSLAIRLESKGKVISKSKRVGTGFMIFDLLKLRSVYTNADKQTAEHTHHGDEPVTANSQTNHFQEKKEKLEKASLKFGNIPRITKVGHVIRRLRIDEFLQLVNVIKGDIALVGNRPLPIFEAELLSPGDWSNRFNAPSGITGLWQVKTRGRSKIISPEERKALDNKYSEIAKSNYSFWKDLWIILRTIPALFRPKSV